MCTHCGTGERWGDGLWCAACLYAVCCSKYPRWNEQRQRMESCVHGGRDGVLKPGRTE